MGMMLSNRQLAMLREMGVRVWQPAPVAKPVVNQVLKAVQVLPVLANLTASETQNAMEKIAVRTRIDSPEGTFLAEIAAKPADREPAIRIASDHWELGISHELYAPLSSSSSPTPSPPGPRWLVLLEAPSAALASGFDPLEGDAGKLLDNMLRAAQLHATGGAVVVPLVRSTEISAKNSLAQTLPELVARLAPAVIFVMGRLASQAVLLSNEPLARLRGRVHTLHGTPTIVSMEPTYLLRKLPDKAKAWEDLCLALSAAQTAAG